MPAEAILANVSPQIAGSRVILRCPEEGDGDMVHQAVVESLEDLRRWPASLPWTLAEPSPAASESFCRISKSQFIARSRLPYLVLHKDTLAFMAVWASTALIGRCRVLKSAFGAAPPAKAKD